MKQFYLLRLEDESGVSGTGRVAEGVIFSNGKCAMNWLTEFESQAIYPSIDELEAIHGHGGKTKVVYAEDLPQLSTRKRKASKDRRKS